MTKLATVIVDKRNIMFFIFIAAAIFCAFSRNWVSVNDDITAYLPEDTETRQGLTLMGDNFTTYSTARVMVENITLSTARTIQQELLDITGVKSVDFDDTEAHYKSASALYGITFNGQNDDPVSIDAVTSLKEILSGYDMYITTEVGNPLKSIINREMLVVDLIAVVIVLSVLFMTSRTYGEIPVLLLTFGAAAVLNMGTNYMMGEISFVTNSVAIVLQLALAIDYAIILCNHFQEQHETRSAREAAIAALSKAIPEISASSLTTVSGLLAMCLMQFRLGLDMGAVLIKAILLSMTSVFLLMPGLLVLFCPWIDRTHHKSFIPKISFLGKFAYHTRFIMPFLFIVVLVLGFHFSEKTNYVYSQSSIESFRKNDTQIAEEKIDDLFGTSNQLAVIIPSGDYDKEAALIDELKSLEHTDSVLGLAGVEITDGYRVTSSVTPRQFSEIAGLDIEVAETLFLAYSVEKDEYGQSLTSIDTYTVPLIDLFDFLIEKEKNVTIELDESTTELLNDLEEQLEDARLQLMSKDWSRIVLNSDIPVEGKESFRYLEVIHGIVGKYYDTAYVIGDTTSSYDLRSSFENDNRMISILTILFVVLVLIFTFNSIGLPLLLILIIQGSIWINFSIPYLRGKNLFFMTYLIISSIQMGANIDYAIVISSRYMELKKEMPLKEAMIETLNFAFPTIITSGAMLASAGYVIAFLTSNETISSIGLYVGQGTLISICLVMLVLPQILIFGDIIIRKTSFKFNLPIRTQHKSGVIRVDGHLVGTFNGWIDGDVHGILRGELNGILDIGNSLLESEEHDLRTNEVLPDYPVTADQPENDSEAVNDQF